MWGRCRGNCSGHRERDYQGEIMGDCATRMSRGKLEDGARTELRKRDKKVGVREL